MLVRSLSALIAVTPPVKWPIGLSVLNSDGASQQSSIPWVTSTQDQNCDLCATHPSLYPASTKTYIFNKHKRHVLQSMLVVQRSKLPSLWLGRSSNNHLVLTLQGGRLFSIWAIREVVSYASLLGQITHITGSTPAVNAQKASANRSITYSHLCVIVFSWTSVQSEVVSSGKRPRWGKSMFLGPCFQRSDLGN